MIARWIGRIRGWRNVGSGAPYRSAPHGPERTEPDPAPAWSLRPFAAIAGDVALALTRGGWRGAGLRRYRSLADGRVTACRKLGEDLVLYEFSAGGAPIGAYAELIELAEAMIRHDRLSVDDREWSDVA